MPSPQNSVLNHASLLDVPAKDESSDEVGYLHRSRAPTSPFRHRRSWFIAGGALILVVLAVVLPVYFAVIKPRHSTNVLTGHSTGAQGTFQIGGDGSTVTKEDGSTFTYRNSFGGHWVSNPENPYDNSAKANAWTPALNESWDWARNRIHGVNLGGLFVLEPFISPRLFQENAGAVDEWTLSQILAQKGADVLQKTLEDHYNTFITEEDIAQIAGAGLNWIRLSIPFWAIEKWDDVGVDGTGAHQAEPFLARTCWKYILRVLGWARKYGIRVNLDLHTIPGSQNGYNHSGKAGTINWLKGVMGLANAERSLDYIRILAEFISQPEWSSVVPMFGVLNEPFLEKVGKDQLRSFYYKTYEMIRSIGGVGEGNGPMISIHDGFLGPQVWADFLPGADRLVIDQHPYFAFLGTNRDPVNITATGGASNGSTLGGKWPLQACNAWAAGVNQSRTAFGVTIAGEFSAAPNDCGLLLDGVGAAPAYGPGCDYWEDAAGWSDATKQGLRAFVLASMDALGDWFFWTWKIGNSTAGSVQAPLWSYSLGLQEGWIPRDPREAAGACAALWAQAGGGAAGAPWDGTFAPHMTGGAGAGTIAPAATQSLVWPPASLVDVPAESMGGLPRYTATGAIATLPPLAATSTAGVAVTAGNGWFDPMDDAPAATPIAGCAYPFAWDAGGAQIPTGLGCVSGQ